MMNLLAVHVSKHKHPGSCSIPELFSDSMSSRIVESESDFMFSNTV